MKTTGNTILITGGGSGIGLALAQRWHDAGNVVIVTGRNSAKLDAAIEGRANMHAMPLDVTDADAIAAFAADVVQRFPDLNVLVNNAGVMMYEALDGERDLSDAEATVVTNLLGPIRLTDALIDHLVARGNGAIVNVTSGLAFVPLPKAPTYSATKAALHSYTQALRVQLAGRVDVIELAPPAVRTELTPASRRATPICRWTPLPTRSWRCSPKRRRRRRFWCAMSSRCGTPKPKARSLNGWRSSPRSDGHSLIAASALIPK